MSIEDDGSLHGRVGRSGKVVGIPTRDISVPGGLCTRVAGVEDLKDVEFATARFPAAALSVAVLEGVWDLSVKHPHRRHVCIEAGLTS